LNLPQWYQRQVSMMRGYMGIVRNRYGVHEARKKVPKRLMEATATVLGASKQRQSWLKKSLGTKDLREAKVRAKPVLMEFDRVLARAEALIAEKPLRATLTQAEIDRMAELHYANVLAEDDEERREGTGSEPVFQSVARQLADAGIEFDTPFHVGSVPEFGLSDREIYKRGENLDFALTRAEASLARGDISFVLEDIEECLSDFQIRLDHKSPAFRELGTAVLKAQVRALRAIERRNAGEPIDTPKAPAIITATVTGETLRAAFEGWKKVKARPQDTLKEYERAITQFVELHGDLSIVQIRRSHARQFREALQEVPWPRTGNLLKAALPELAQWGRDHPEEPQISTSTVNKQLGAVQTIALWARDNGLIPDDVAWADPFSRMRLEEDDPDREPFTPAELRKLFAAPVFTEGERPIGGRGEAAFWLPMLGLFSGARQSELAGLSVPEIRTDESSGVTALFITKDRERGKRLKTRQSQRAVPVHSELVKLGFLDYVQDARRTHGDDAWLFPLIAPGTGGVKAWSKWFGRYLREAGINDRAKVFHSFRHNFKDALRAAGVGEEVHDALTGHSTRGEVSREYGTKDITKRFGWQTLASAIAKVAYPGLDLSGLRLANCTTEARGETKAR
jgi:integrase